jgi:hypothetical protein
MSMNMHMSQSMSASGPMAPQNQQQQPFSNSNAQNTATPPASADFSLEFLDNLPSGDTSQFSEQELLSSLDTSSGFILDGL